MPYSLARDSVYSIGLVLFVEESLRCKVQNCRPVGNEHEIFDMLVVTVCVTTSCRTENDSHYLDVLCRGWSTRNLLDACPGQN